MTKEQAQWAATYLSDHHPCIKRMMVANGVAMLRDLGIPVPAWTVPARHWLHTFEHEGVPGRQVTGSHGDEEIVRLLRATRYYGSGRIPPRRQWVTIKTWRCPIHEGGAA